jgi:hypothetical protein
MRRRAETFCEPLASETTQWEYDAPAGAMIIQQQALSFKFGGSIMSDFLSVNDVIFSLGTDVISSSPPPKPHQTTTMLTAMTEQ